MPKLGVNIDHVATLRQARQEFEPDPIEAAQIVENAGADSIVAHLREDARHINKKDIENLKKSLRTRFNLEMSMDPAIVKIAIKIKPDQATLVPEKRNELTTEGGLDVIGQFQKIKRVTQELQAKKIEVSLFIDPIKSHIKKTKESGIDIIELHTGKYANAKKKEAQDKELKKITAAAQYAHSLGMTVSAGHGLKYDNVSPIAKISEIEELNIGHSIIARSIFVGLGSAVKEMNHIINH